MNRIDLFDCVKNINLYSHNEQIRILDKLGFDFYLRKGYIPEWVTRLQKLAVVAPIGFKFNPWHDDLGRFTFGPGGATPVSNDTSDGKVPKSWGNPETLAKHFKDHGGDFGAQSSEDYADQANQFLKRTLQENLPAVEGPDGTLRAYDLQTNTFGVYNSDGTTATFFKPREGAAYFQEQIETDLPKGGQIINPFPVNGGGGRGGGLGPIGKPGLNPNLPDEIVD